MNALKAVGIATGAVAATLVTVSLIQRHRQKKALKAFEKAVDDMQEELNRSFGGGFDFRGTGF